MKRCLFLLAMIAVVSCEPSVRYSPAPSKPVSGRSTTKIEQSAGRNADIGSAVDPGRMRSIIEGYLGTSYRRGGYGKLGVDCSGLVYAVYRDYSNLHLPPNSRKLFDRLQRVDYQDLRLGDLVFFSLNGKHASHVGIYVDDNRFVHASEARGVVISSLTDDYYRESFVGARRVLE